MTYGISFPRWRAGAPDRDAHVRAPFVQSLADGSLPRRAFLINFARAWTLAG